MTASDQEILEAASSRRHYTLGAILTIAASPLVLGAVVLMNELSQPPDRHEVERGSIIEVAKAPPPPPPPKQVQRPKPKPKASPKAPPPPALGALGAGAGNFAVDLPGFGFEDLGADAGELLASGKEVVHTSDTVDTPPQAYEQEPMTYPSKLRDKGVEGYVMLSLLIDKSGTVERAKVIESKPPGVFDEVATQGIRGWRFQPARYKGEAVKVWVRQKIRFDLRS